MLSTQLYLLLLFIRVLLSWFPTFTWWDRQPWLALRQVTDPYLKLFSGLVPPLLGTIDLTPLIGFFILQARELDRGKDRVEEALQAMCQDLVGQWALCMRSGPGGTPEQRALPYFSQCPHGDSRTARFAVSGGLFGLWERGRHVLVTEPRCMLCTRKSIDLVCLSLSCALLHR